MREEMVGKLINSHPSQHSRFDIQSWKYFSLFVPWFGVRTILFPAQGKVTYKKKESTKTHNNFTDAFEQ